MPRFQVLTNPDAEILVMDAALSRVARGVGRLVVEMEPGLYKVKVNRAGSLREQLVELQEEGTEIELRVETFRAVAPVAAMLSDPGAVNALGFLATMAGHDVVVMTRQPLELSPPRIPLAGMRLFRWGDTRGAIALARSEYWRQPGPSTQIIGDERWAVNGIRLTEGHAETFILEMRRGGRVSRQPVLVSPDWQTRIFIGIGGKKRTGPSSVSIQMARPHSPLVYQRGDQSAEVTRIALTKGRTIFLGHDLLEMLLSGKFEHPLMGIAGLHLFLDAVERRKAGDTSYDPEGVAKYFDHTPCELIDQVLINMTRLLHPDRPAQAGKDLVFADPDQPESADLTALRVRAGRIAGRVRIATPPMFRASWDALVAAAAHDDRVWIERSLWRVVGQAGAIAPYLAWSPGKRSVGAMLTAIGKQVNLRIEFSQTLSKAAAQLAPFINPADPASWPSSLTEKLLLPKSILGGNPPARPTSRRR
ncbi:hypothetical protein [Niveispirillum sp. KHB5.9]|uniref:hypothetical protein n=1 Tax=Niveispirillum sp. KHB5.9 TaxID=3400269 RepID=UPI003A87FB20